MGPMLSPKKRVNAFYSSPNNLSYNWGLTKCILANALLDYKVLWNCFLTCRNIINAKSFYTGDPANRYIFKCFKPTFFTGNSSNNTTSMVYFVVQIKQPVWYISRLKKHSQYRIFQYYSISQN